MVDCELGLEHGSPTFMPIGPWAVKLQSSFCVGLLLNRSDALSIIFMSKIGILNLGGGGGIRTLDPVKGCRFLRPLSLPTLNASNRSGVAIYCSGSFC